MANKSNLTLQKGRKRVRMRTRISVLILLAVIVQLLTAGAVLFFGGEFRTLREYACQSFAKQAADQSACLHGELQEKALVVQGCAEQLGSRTEALLAEHGASAAALQTDEALNRNLLEGSAELVSELLQQTAADDAYLILESGTLFTDADGRAANAALYLTGGDAIQTVSAADADFYLTAVQTAQAHSSLTLADLGCWSRFSAISPALVPSMKYSLPLKAADGTVYGVLGIGLTAETVLSALPAQQYADGDICYALGYGDSDTGYEILARTGAAALLGDTGSLLPGDSEDEGICTFKTAADTVLSGCVKDLALYSTRSPYAAAQWVLIAAAEPDSVLWPVLILKRMLAVAAVLSLLAAAMFAIPGSRVIIRPLTELSGQIKTTRKSNDVLRFRPSNIYEIDEITDAITQMQINIHGFSSQVSKMISVADVGLGTFMYDRTDDSVFVGQSLIKVLRLNLPQGEDIVMHRQEFLNSIENPEVRTPVSEGMEMPEGKMRKDFSKVYEINRMQGGKLWIRLSFTYSPNTIIGIVQDITDATMEKNRIEYERDYDHLTGLLNRQAYYRRIEKLFHEEKEKLNITAFVMIDLDNLKYVNDTYGHNFGDDYIRTAATALKQAQEHGGIVSRLSGDEFSLCLPGFSSKEAARKVISGVRTALLEGSCLLADGTHFKVSGSMGIAWYPEDSDSRELLMKYADFAMYTVKHAHKGDLAEFDWNSYSANSVLLTGVEEMNRIFRERSVKYAFQSIVSAKTGEIYGYEALMRVQSEIFRSPLELLRTAKSGAKLYEIEHLTLTKSLEDFRALIEAGKIDKTAHIFINSIANNRLEQEVEDEITQLYPEILKQIVVEILEGETSDGECTAHKAQCVRSWGGQLALDDFGTGYNSEYALLSIRPNIIKIDRSIISDCDQDSDRRMIIENLVKLARAKGILVLAEGVETRSELETVISCGVDFLQGYYLAKPLFEPEPLPPELVSEIRRFAAEVSPTDL